jgi:hypothetical protein
VARQAARHFPPVVATGPRRSGKTTLFRQLFPTAQYVLIEDPDIQGQIRSGPRTFLEDLQPPVLFDEIQNAPELLSYVRTLIEAAPRRMGQWLPSNLFGTRRPGNHERTRLSTPFHKYTNVLFITGALHAVMLLSGGRRFVPQKPV